MSESLTAETISVDKTEALNESKDEEEILAIEILPPCNTSKEEEIQNEKQENLTETKDITKEVVSVATVDATKPPQKCTLHEDHIMETKTKDTDVSSPIKLSPQSNDDNENPKNLNEVRDSSEEEGRNSSCDVTTETIEASVNFSLPKENQDENLNTSSSGEETSLDKDSLETSLEEALQEKDSSSDVTRETTKSSLKSSVTEENQDTKNAHLAQKTPQDKELSETITEEVSEEKALPTDNITEILKSPLKYSSSQEIQDKDTNTTSSAQEPQQVKDSTETTTTKETTSSSTKPSSKDEYAEHVTYTEDGSAIYTDPQTKYQYKWCAKANNWIPRDSNSDTTNPYENEHYKWCSETQKWLPKKTQVTETEHYKWDAEKQEWIAKVKHPITTTSSEQTTNPSEVIYDIDEDGQRIYTDKDGAVFFWDVEKNAWFPKIDDDFMARYQMSYGFIDNTSESEREKEKREQESKLLKEKELEKLVEEAKANYEAASNDKQGVKRKQQEPPKWFDVDPLQNTKVYVSNLPLDITLDEFSDLMSKCGMIMLDPQTQKYKLKLYTEADGQIKGDGLCDYIKVESVDLALKILDEYELRGHKIRVQQAQFQMRGEYNPALKPKRKKKDKEKLAKIKEKLFDWRPEKMRGERSKHEKTVIIKNLFHPELFEKEVQLILDYQNDLREECAKCGTVRKVVIYDRHSEGVAQINMASPEEADLVIQMMQGRFFGKRQLTAEHWDGKTKYKVEETEEEIQKRLNKWDQYLETDEKNKLDLKKEEQSDLQNDEQSDLQKDEQSGFKNDEQSDLQKNDQSELQQDEQDIEKTINFEASENSQITQKVEDTQILEDNLKED